MPRTLQTYHLYLAARRTHRKAQVVLGFLLVRLLKATTANTPAVISVWPSSVKYQGQEFILPEVKQYEKLEIKGIQALMLLEHSLPIDAFAIDAQALPMRSASGSLQKLNWSYKFFMGLALAGRFDLQATPLSWPNIVKLLRDAILLPSSPIPTFNLHGVRNDAFTLPPPQASTSHVDVAPANPYREHYIRLPPPSSVMSEAQWSTRGTIGIGSKYHLDSPFDVDSSSPFTQQQDQRVLFRTTTHHRSQRDKENVDFRAQRRAERKVPKPEPLPEIVTNIPHHRNAAQPRSILKSKSKPYARYGQNEQAWAMTPQRVGMDLQAPRYHAGPEHNSRSARRARGEWRGPYESHEEIYAKAEERVRRMSRSGRHHVVWA